VKTEHKILTIQDAPAEGDAFLWGYYYDAEKKILPGQVNNNLEKREWASQ